MECLRIDLFFRSLISSMQCNHKKYLLCLNIITLILNRNDDDYFSLKSHICFNCEKGRNSSPQYFFWLYVVALHDVASSLADFVMLHKTFSSVSRQKIKINRQNDIKLCWHAMWCVCVWVFCNVEQQNVISI